MTFMPSIVAGVAMPQAGTEEENIYSMRSRSFNDATLRVGWTRFLGRGSLTPTQEEFSVRVDEIATIGTGTGYGITLDGRLIKTPMGHTLVVPSILLAAQIAAEWDAVESSGSNAGIVPAQIPRPNPCRYRHDQRSLPTDRYDPSPCRLGLTPPRLRQRWYCCSASAQQHAVVARCVGTP